MTLIAGIDGCKKGWLRVEEDRASGELRARVVDTMDPFRDAARFSVLAIDIPIGLPATDRRPCDVEARALLRAPRASSVFPAPIRPVLDATTYPEALRIARSACGRGMSKQAFAIMSRIATVDRHLQADGSLRQRVREVHPELCFYFLADERPMRYAKRTPEGAVERDELLRRAFGADAYRSLRAAVPRSGAADDDIRDAMVALWTARRIAAGEARTIPARPTRDAFGLTMEMVV